MDINDYLLAKKCSNPACHDFIHTAKNTCSQCGQGLELFYDYFSLFQLNDYSDYVSETQFLEALKKSYKLLSLKFHPDVNPHPNANRSFSLIQEGFQILSHPEKREDYLYHLDIFEDLYQHNEIPTEDWEEADTSFPPDSSEETTSQKVNNPLSFFFTLNIRKANILAGLFLSVIVYLGLTYYPGNQALAFSATVIIIALSISVIHFLKIILILAELIATGTIFFIIAEGHLMIAAVCSLLVLVYFSKFRKSLNALT